MWAGIRRHLRLLAGEAPPVAMELTGVLEVNGSQVDARYVGSGSNRDFLLRLVMDEWQERACRLLASYRDVPGEVSAALKSSASYGRPFAILTDLPALWGLLTPRAAQYRFPAWVRHELALPPPGARWVLPRAVEREAARLVRRHGYTVNFVTDDDALRRFFHELYRPYVVARFAGEGVVAAEQEFFRKARGCTLARLHGQGQWLAGVLLERSGATLRFRWFGAKSDPPAPGASDVLDVACIRHAHATGARRVMLGHSRPSLTDGVVRYKAKLGARLHSVRYPQAVLGITVRGEAGAVLERLNRRQLVVVKGDRARVLEAR